MAKNHYPGVYEDKNGTFRITTGINIAPSIRVFITKRGYETPYEAHFELQQIKLFVKGKAFGDISQSLMEKLTAAYEEHQIELPKTDKNKTMFERMIAAVQKKDDIYVLRDSYIKLMFETKWKEKTRIINSGHLDLILNTFESQIVNDIFTEVNLQKMRAWILNLNIKAASKNAYLIVFKSFADYLFNIKAVINQKQLSYANAACLKIKVTERISQTTKKENGRRVLTDEEIECILNSYDLTKPQDEMFYCMISLLSSRAPRKAELLGLQRRDFDFENKTMTIKRQYLGSGKYGTTKTGIERTIPLSDKLVRLFKTYFEKNNFEPNERIFPISTVLINRHLDKKCDKLGLTRTWIHAFRTKLATDMLNREGNSLQEQTYLAYILGHNVGTDMSSYAKVKVSELNVIADKIDK